MITLTISAVLFLLGLTFFIISKKEALKIVRKSIEASQARAIRAEAKCLELATENAELNVVIDEYVVKFSELSMLSKELNKKDKQ